MTTIATTDGLVLRVNRHGLTLRVERDGNVRDETWHSLVALLARVSQLTGRRMAGAA